MPDIDIRRFGRAHSIGPRGEFIIREGFDYSGLVKELRDFADRIDQGRVNVECAHHLQFAERDGWHGAALYIEFEEFEEPPADPRKPPERVIDLP